MKTNKLQCPFILFPFLLLLFSSTVAQQFTVEARLNSKPWGVLENQILCANDQLTLRMDLGLKPKLWLDAMDVNPGIEPTPGTRIDKWQDKSGNNFTVVAPNVNLKPSYDPAGFNGLPAVMFGMDNAPDGMELFDTSEDDFFEGDWSIAILGEGRDRTVGRADLIGNITSGTNGWFFRFDDKGQSQTGVGSNLQTSTVVRPRPYSFITVLVKEGNRFRTYIDGVLDKDFTIANGVALTLNKAIYLGQADGGTTTGDNFHKGPIAELLVFDRTIAASERIQLEGYLANKWLSNANLSVSHPYKTFSPLNIIMKTPSDSVFEFTSYHQEFLFNPTKASDYGDFTFTAKGETVPSDTITIQVTAELSTPENAISYSINNTGFTKAKEATVSYGNTIALKATFGGDYQWQSIASGRYLPENTDPVITSVESGFEMGEWELYYYQGGCLNSDKAYRFNVKGPNPTVYDIPGVLEAENFISKSPIIKIENGGSNKNITSITNNTFTEYNVDVIESGMYEVIVSASAAAAAGGSVKVSVDGNVVGTLNITSTTSWTNYMEFRQDVTINAGGTTVRLDYETTNVYAFNVDKIEFKLGIIDGASSLINSEEVSIYPNPSESGIFKLSEAGAWEVSSLQGLVVLQGTGEQVDLSNQGQGVYFLRIDNTIKKIIVK